MSVRRGSATTRTRLVAIGMIVALLSVIAMPAQGASDAHQLSPGALTTGGYAYEGCCGPTNGAVAFNQFQTSQFGWTFSIHHTLELYNYTELFGWQQAGSYTETKTSPSEWHEVRMVLPEPFPRICSHWYSRNGATSVYHKTLSTGFPESAENAIHPHGAC